MSNQLEAEYRSLLRWYPREWRERNEAVVLGILLDAAQAAGLKHPSDADRRSLWLGGLQQRAIGSGRRFLVGTGALAVGVLFSVFYCSVVAWDPAHHYAGYVGAFTNPSLVTAALLAVAFVLSIRRVTSLARVVAVLSVVSSVIIGLLSWDLSWLGPSLPTVVGFGAFGLVGLSRSNRILRGLLLGASSVFAVVAAESLETMWLQVSQGMPAFWPVETSIAVAATAASALFAWPWMRRPRSPREWRRESAQ